MPFRVSGLDAAPFRPLFAESDEALAARGILRRRIDAGQGAPDRIGLRDAEPGESVLLLNHTSLDGLTPYRATHAIHVSESAGETHDAVGPLPAMLRRRLLSLRAFDAAHLLVDADVVEGEAAEPVIERLLADPRAAFVHAHFARHGCYAARITRA
jgi:hypothetical protein